MTHLLDESYVGSKVVAFGKDGSVLLDLPRGGDRRRVWVVDQAAAEEARIEAAAAERKRGVRRWQWSTYWVASGSPLKSKGGSDV